MEIRENDLSLLQDFIRLNEQWITTYFELEESDRVLAANPGKVVKEGGFIFSLVTGDSEVLGVCALFNEGNSVYKLAQMAVAPEHQGKGYANLLMTACMDKLTTLNAERVYLVSNTKLKPAIALYKKYGFITVSEGQDPIYVRANIVMERKLG